MMPPQLQSPQSNLSSQAQVFTPQAFVNDYHVRQKQQPLNVNESNISVEFNENLPSYQSYQNTPSKAVVNNRNPFRNTNIKKSS